MSPNPSAEFQARLATRKAEVSASYPQLWKRLIREWKSPGPENRAWLLYSANYLFRTGEVRWAIDPLVLNHCLPTAPAMDLARDLDGSAYVLLTHRHKDHFDLKLIRELSSLPILWVVQQDLLQTVEQAGLSREKIIVPAPLETIQLPGLNITPFKGLHWESASERPDGYRGVPSTGYLVEFNGKRWLFPGDVRNYDSALLPPLGRLDGAFVHLWLGRSAALLDTPPLLDAFGRFCRNLHAPRLIITHLHELGREETDYWEERHFTLVKQAVQEFSPKISLTSAVMGEWVDL